MVIARTSNVLRRITTLLIICCLVTVGLCVNTAAALTGSGTQADPWRIESLADFDEFAAAPNYWSGFTRLETDVNLAGRTYTTAIIAPDVNNANYWQFDGTPFTGVFDGNDHKIILLTIDDVGAGNDFLGLFGRIQEDGEVRNLGLEGGSVSGDRYVGGIVGANDDPYSSPGGAISNCYSTGDVNGVDYLGGLVGCNWGNISHCYSTGDVNGGGGVGGLVGYNLGGSISNCYSTGDVSGGWSVGGLVGQDGEMYFQGGAVSNCYSTGDVTGYSTVGGLAGGITESAVVSNCYSAGNVSGDECVGGLVGSNGSVSHEQEHPGWISNSYSTGNVQGASVVGGLVGDNVSGDVSSCYSIGDVSGVEDVGGLVGWNGYLLPFYGLGHGYIFNSYSIGSVQGASNVGGLVGYNFCGFIERSLWDVQTSGEPNMCGEQYDWRATGCDPNCGKTTAEMQTKSTFTEAGWDFVDIWLINEGATYPVLRQETRSDLNGNAGVDLLDFAIFADHWLEGTAD